MRLGDLDDLKVHISELMLVYSGEELDNAILNAIDNAQTVEERPQGKWVFDSEFTEFGNPYGAYKCSICGCYSPNKYYFCKDCGADMKGGVK